MALKIYFCGSIRAGRQDADLYFNLIKKLKEYGEVLTEHVGTPSGLDCEIDITDDKFIFERDMNWLKKCDVVVAECTQPSHGVGIEIGQAIALNKRTLCLFRPNNPSGFHLSALIKGAEKGDHFNVQNYETVDDASSIFQTFLCPKSR